MQKTVADIHKYNQHKKGTLAASHIVEGGLGIACLVPSAVGPAAQIALTGFEMVTGGSEENKVMRQVYLHKLLLSRTKVLESKAEMALQNYQLGILTRNPALIAFAESILAEMSGEAVAREALGTSILPASKDSKAESVPGTAEKS